MDDERFHSIMRQLSGVAHEVTRADDLQETGEVGLGALQGALLHANELRAILQETVREAHELERERRHAGLTS